MQVYGEAAETASSQSRTRHGRKTDPSYRMTLSRGTAGTNGQSEPSPLGLDTSNAQSFQQLVSPRNISASERRMERLKVDLDKLAQTVQKAASDKLELMRDLATYEFLFCRDKAAGEKLGELWAVAAEFPSEYVSKSKAASWEHETQKDISAGFQHIEEIEFSLQPPDIPEDFEKSSFDLRLLNDISRYRQLYRGMHVVSNVHCVVTVKSNGLFRQLIIAALTLEGIGYPLTVRQDMMERESLMTKEQIKSAVRSFILPHLYFQSGPNGSQLLFHQSYAVTFLSLVIALKGSGAPGPMAVQLTQDGDNVFATMGFGQVTINRGELTQKPSIFEEKQRKLADKLRNGLLYVKTDRTVVWLSSPSPSYLFTLKEENSPFVNEEFISERLQTLTFQLQATEKLTIDSVVYKVEFLSHKSLLKLRIACGELSCDIEPGSAEMQFLVCLQCGDWRTGKVTLMRSLELKTVIKQIL